MSKKIIVFLIVVYVSFNINLIAQSKVESIEKIVKSMQFLFNDFLSIDTNLLSVNRTVYSLTYNNSDSTITILEKEFLKDKKNVYDTLGRIISLHINDLHSKGFFINQSGKSMYRLKVLPYNNEQRIKSILLLKNEIQHAAIQNGYSIGPLDSTLYYDKLKVLKTKFEMLASFSRNNISKYAPDSDICNVIDFTSIGREEYDTVNWRNYTIYYSQYTDIQPLFENARSFNENKELVEQFISREISELHIKVKFIVGYIKISENGVVEDFYNQDYTSKYKKAIKKVILSMPKWKPGFLKAEKVKTLYKIYYKITNT